VSRLDQFSALLPLIVSVMSDFDVFDGDVHLFAGWIDTESAWNPWAVRFEPAFFRRYVDPIPNLSITEKKARATSWGLLQVMGQVARENGFSKPYLSALCEPRENIELACRILKQRYQQSDRTWNGALAAYNGGLGGNRRAPFRNQFYSDKVFSNAEFYR
jgi:soluble lytic murein transglycosylase-like protein